MPIATYDTNKKELHLNCLVSGFADAYIEDESVTIVAIKYLEENSNEY